MDLETSARKCELRIASVIANALGDAIFNLASARAAESGITLAQAGDEIIAELAAQARLEMSKTDGNTERN